MTNEMLPCVVGFQSSGWYLRESGRPIKLAAMLIAMFQNVWNDLRAKMLTVSPRKIAMHESVCEAR
jgi:hypothetical protein